MTLDENIALILLIIGISILLLGTVTGALALINNCADNKWKTAWALLSTGLFQIIFILFFADKFDTVLFSLMNSLCIAMMVVLLIKHKGKRVETPYGGDAQRTGE